MNPIADLDWYAPHGWAHLVPRGTPFEPRAGRTAPSDRVYTDDERRAARISRALDAMAHESDEGRLSRLVLIAWHAQSAYVVDRARAVLQLVELAAICGTDGPAITTVWRLDQRLRQHRADRTAALRRKGEAAARQAREALERIDVAERALALWRAKPRSSFGALMDRTAALVASLDSEGDRIGWARVRTTVEARAAYERWARATHGMVQPEDMEGAA